MDIKFDCQKCGQRYEVDGSMAGQRIECQACKEEIVIPLAAASNEPIRLELSDEPGKKSKRMWKPLRILLFIIGGIVAIPVLFIAFFILSILWGVLRDFYMPTHAQETHIYTQAESDAYHKEHEANLAEREAEALLTQEQKAFKLYAKMAQDPKADAIILYNLAVCYNKGIGCDQDDVKAKTFLIKAADRGSAEAKAALSEMGYQWSK